MQARNRRTGAAITGTLERLYGKCELIADAFERNDDGRITHENEGGTKMLWDSSEQVVDDGERIYLDENDEEVAESDIELHDANGTPEPRTPPRPRPAANATDDPEAAARGIAERFIASMVDEVDDYHEQMAVAREVGRTDGEEAAEKAVSEAHNAFTRNACDGIAGIDVASDLIDLAVARAALAPIIRHVNVAVIRLEGPNALQIRCRRDGERFRVDEISAREYGHVCSVKPDKTWAAHADVYANTILQACGLC